MAATAWRGWDEQVIHSIRIQNYKTHVDTTVPLSPLTVLVGPNGAGKSAVLEALALPWRVYAAARDRAWFKDRGHSQGVRCGTEFSELNVSVPGGRFGSCTELRRATGSRSLRTSE